MKIDNRYAFIWDLDGTLIDSYEVIVDSLFIMARRYGLDDSRDRINDIVIAGEVGNYLDIIKSRTGIDRDALIKEYRQNNDIRKDDISLIPHAKETLKAIEDRGGKNFLFTHRGESTGYLLERLGLNNLFIETITGTSGFPRKPKGDAIIYLMKKHGLDKDHTFYVGDRNIDIDCAADAKIKGILYKPAGSFCRENGRQHMIIDDLYCLLDD